MVNIVSIGECCVDIYSKTGKKFLGGTAFNVAVQANRAGANASILSAIGTDSNADLFHKAFKTSEIDISHLKVLEGQTSHIDVNLDSDYKPAFSNWELGVLKKYKLNSADTEFINKHDVAHVVLFKPTFHLFEQFCAMKFLNVLKSGDFAGSSAYSEGIRIIEKYIESIDIVIKSLDKEDLNSLEFLKRLSSKYKDKIILSLLGENGSVVFLNGITYKQSTIKSKVIDTNGAGDAYVACFLVNYVKMRSIAKSMLEGAKAAGYKVGHFGAVDFKV